MHYLPRSNKSVHSPASSLPTYPPTYLPTLPSKGLEKLHHIPGRIYLDLETMPTLLQRFDTGAKVVPKSPQLYPRYICVCAHGDEGPECRVGFIIIIVADWDCVCVCVLIGCGFCFWRGLVRKEGPSVDTYIFWKRGDAVMDSNSLEDIAWWKCERAGFGGGREIIACEELGLREV